MAPDITTEKLHVSISSDTLDMLKEMARQQFGNRQRVLGIMVEQLVREKYLWYTKEVKERA